MSRKIATEETRRVVSAVEAGSPTVETGAAAGVWASLTEIEREVHRRAGYHQVFGVGTRPALLIIDVEYNFTGFEGQETLESVDMYPNSSAAVAWGAMPTIVDLLAVAREHGVPVIYTHGLPEDDGVGVPRPGTDILDEIAPLEGELVVAKSAASAFFDTEIAAYMQKLGVDTVIHVGCTTSGCVRASVVDAASHGFNNIVVEEGVFDRAAVPHAHNLFDMDAKYADVWNAERTLAYLRGEEGER